MSILLSTPIRAYALGAAAGYKMGKYRVEGEVGYQKNNVDECESSCRRTSGDIKAYSFLINGYYDFFTKSGFTPFLSAGIGVAKVDGDVNRIAHVEDTAVAIRLAPVLPMQSIKILRSI